MSTNNHERGSFEFGLTMRISEHPRTITTLLRRFCTAEVRGSNPLGSTLKYIILQVQRVNDKGAEMGFGTFIHQ
jgi:hypothetical protein